MDKKYVKKFLDYFKDVKDPRDLVKLSYKLEEVFLLTLVATIAGAETMVDIANYGKEKLKFLRKYLPYQNGTPSHDTLSIIFKTIDPESFSKCFMKWVREISGGLFGEVICIDGKTIKGSKNSGTNDRTAHIVSAFASNKNLILGQVKVDEKSNEITAIPELLEGLDVDGAIVTIDAMGCQEEIARKIVNKKGNYLFSLKGNQCSLHEDIKYFFESEKKDNFKEIECDYFETIEKDHGRIETRKIWATSDIGTLKTQHARWEKLHSIIMIESVREIKEKVSSEIRYFISSLPANAELIGVSARSHWGIENKVHWILDVVFHEDLCRSREGNVAENLAYVRKIALNILKAAGGKDSIRAKRFKAAWSDDFMKSILSATKSIC